MKAPQGETSETMHNSLIHSVFHPISLISRTTSMTNTNLTTVQQPIDYEALPLPYAHTPQLIQTLVKQLPDCVCAFLLYPCSVMTKVVDNAVK